MKKTIFMCLLITLYLVSGIRAYADEIDKTIDYRYRFIGYDGNWYQGAWTEWRQERDVNFTDNNTDTLAMTNSNYGTTTITCVDLVSSIDGSFYFKGQKVAGGAGTIMLADINVDYIYKYANNTVDTNYTFTITLDKPNNYSYNWCKVYIYGINRLDGSYTEKKQIFYKNSASHQYDEYAWTESYTYEGSDGYNYSGFVIRVDMQPVNNQIYLDNSMYELWKYTSSLDTFTPEVNIGEQLDNINGTLGSIYSAITNIPTTIVNAINSVKTDISNLPSSIASGIKHIFIYDNWEQDLRLMAEDIEIPMISQLTYDTAVILDYFTSYTPKHDFNIKIPKLTRNSNSRLVFSGYMINVPFDLADVLNFEINGVSILSAIRIITSFGATIYIFMLTARFLYAAGIDVYDYVHPVIEQFIVESGVWGQEV